MIVYTETYPVTVFACIKNQLLNNAGIGKEELKKIRKQPDALVKHAYGGSLHQIQLYFLYVFQN